VTVSERFGLALCGFVIIAVKVDAAKTMIERTEERFALKPERHRREQNGPKLRFA
jgi:hypothetical protein